MALVTSGSAYMLVNALSRTVMDLQGGSGVNGTAVIGWDAHINDGPYVGKNQQWRLTASATDTAPDGSPYYTLTNLMGGTNLALDSATNGLQVTGRKPNSASDNQKWSFAQLPKAYPGTAQVNAYTVCSKLGFCLDMEGGNRTDTAPIVATTNTNATEQVWMLVVLQ